MNTLIANITIYPTTNGRTYHVKYQVGSMHFVSEFPYTKTEIRMNLNLSEEQFQSLLKEDNGN